MITWSKRRRSGPETAIVFCASACLAAGLLAAPLAAYAAQSASIPPPTDKEIIDSPLDKPAPEYPDRALQANMQGSVVLAVTIAPDGRVSKAEVVSADPEGWFEEKAIEAVKAWKYRSPRREITFEVRIDFTLPE